MSTIDKARIAKGLILFDDPKNGMQGGGMENPGYVTIEDQTYDPSRFHSVRFEGDVTEELAGHTFVYPQHSCVYRSLLDRLEDGTEITEDFPMSVVTPFGLNFPERLAKALKEREDLGL